MTDDDNIIDDEEEYEQWVTQRHADRMKQNVKFAKDVTRVGEAYRDYKNKNKNNRVAANNRLGEHKKEKLDERTRILGKPKSKIISIKKKEPYLIKRPTMKTKSDKDDKVFVEKNKKLAAFLGYKK